jgi:hypothetical protein
LILWGFWPLKLALTNNKLYIQGQYFSGKALLQEA